MNAIIPDKKNLPSDIIDGIKEFLKEKVEFALLFGSTVTGRVSAESDIDIGVFFNKTPGFDEYIELKRTLSEASNRDVDLVTLNTCDTIISMQILATGIIFINNNPGFFVRYKAGIIGEYIDFKIDRKIVEDNLLQGRLYA